MIQRFFILILFFIPQICFGQNESLRYQINYSKGRYELTSKNRQVLSIILDTLVGKKNYIIFINGHTDSDADSSYNQQLSLKRSLTVKDFLIEKGMDESLIKVQAQGEEQPLVANKTPLEKARNRRVEIIIFFPQTPEEKIIEVKQETGISTCSGDTTVVLEGGYVLTLSLCDWKKNSECIRVEKKINYKFKIKENWLKKHIGFKNYKKVISYEPHYEFYVVSCTDSCFQSKVKLYIPHYNAQGLNISAKYSQIKNEKKQVATLAFKKTRLGDSAYYVADIYCPGYLNCGTDNRCKHQVDLYAKNKIFFLSYSYYERSHTSYFDSLIEVKPSNLKRLTDIYPHAFFQSLKILHNGDTVILKKIPIDVFAHNKKKIVTGISGYEKTYLLFIPFRKKYKCGHFKKYKIRPTDIENLKHFNLHDLEMEIQEKNK